MKTLFILILSISTISFAQVESRVKTTGLEKLEFTPPEGSSDSVKKEAKKINLQIVAKIQSPSQDLTPTKTLIKGNTLYIVYMKIGEETRGAIDAYDLTTGKITAAIRTNSYEFLDVSDSFVEDEIIAGGQMAGVGASLIYIKTKPTLKIDRHEDLSGYFVTAIQKESQGYTVYSAANGGRYLYNKDMQRIKTEVGATLDQYKTVFSCGEIFTTTKDSGKVDRSVNQVVRKSAIPGAHQGLWTDKSKIYLAQGDGGLWVYDGCGEKKFMGFYGRLKRPYFFTASTISVQKVSDKEKLVIISDKNNTYLVKEWVK